MSIKAYKKFMKKKITESAFEYLEADKETKSKVKNLQYKKLSTQKYIKSGKFKDEEVFLLCKLRSRNVQVKKPFSGMYADILCSLGCPEAESQQHILECKPLVDKSNVRSVINSVNYSDIF